MSVATLSIRPNAIGDAAPIYSFDTFPSVDGYASSQAWDEEEELTSSGIDGKRWRTIFAQVPPIQVDEAWSSTATHIGACDMADSMRKAKGHFGTLLVTSGGTRTVRMLVHVTAVQARVNPGAIVGPSISGAASVFSSWVLDVLEAL